MKLHINLSVKKKYHTFVISACIFILMTYQQHNIKFQASVCFEELYPLGGLQAFVGTPWYSDTDYLPPKDTSVNPARMLFCLKWTEYLISLIYRMLLSKAARYLAVTASLINIIIRIFSPPTLHNTKINLWSKGQRHLSRDIIDLLEASMGCYWCLQTPRDYTQTHISVKLSSSFYFHSAWNLQPSALQTKVAGVVDCIHRSCRREWAMLISELTARDLTGEVGVWQIREWWIQFWTAQDDFSMGGRKLAQVKLSCAR